MYLLRDCGLSLLLCEQMSPAKADPDDDNMGGEDDIFQSPAPQRKKPAAKVTIYISRLYVQGR